MIPLAVKSGQMATGSDSIARAVPNNTAGPFRDFQPSLLVADQRRPSRLCQFFVQQRVPGRYNAPNFLYILPMIQGKISGTPAATGKELQVNPGGQTVYDPVTNITWLANANLAATNTFGLPACKDPTTPARCVNLDGAMTWDSAYQFVLNMNTYNGAGYIGLTRWELPPVDQSCDTAYLCADVGSGNPLGELFYGQLGLGSGMPVVAAPATAVGPFILNPAVQRGNVGHALAYAPKGQVTSGGRSHSNS